MELVRHHAVPNRPLVLLERVPSLPQLLHHRSDFLFMLL
jgi:hypothetical protein